MHKVESLAMRVSSTRGPIEICIAEKTPHSSLRVSRRFRLLTLTTIDERDDLLFNLCIIMVHYLEDKNRRKSVAFLPCQFQKRKQIVLFTYETGKGGGGRRKLYQDE